MSVKIKDQLDANFMAIEAKVLTTRNYLKQDGFNLETYRIMVSEIEKKLNYIKTLLEINRQ
jgi:hypothetical protein